MRKIAIVGTSNTYKLAPFDQKDWEIWGLNQKCNLLPRFDRWFDLHKPEHIINNSDYYKFLKNNASKAWTASDYIPGTNLYPKTEIINKFGDFFTNSISWMIALALHEGVDKLGIYGVDMMLPTEYAHQRPSVLYFIGIAKSMGIEVILPEESMIFHKNELYWLK